MSNHRNYSIDHGSYRYEDISRYLRANGQERYAASVDFLIRSSKEKAAREAEWQAYCNELRKRLEQYEPTQRSEPRSYRAPAESDG